jgi:hypothetical protein
MVRSHSSSWPPSSLELGSPILLSPQLFKVYAAQSVGVGLSFVQDLKLGHYMKIPPRTTFTSKPALTYFAVCCR